MTVSGPKGREHTLHYGLRNRHLRTALPDVVNGLGYCSAVFLAACAGFILG